MPLEQAGVDLQAKGFQDYIKKLAAIEKKQKEVFEQDFKGLGISYSKATSEAKKYNQQLNKTTKSQISFNQVLSTAALVTFAKQMAVAGFELAKLGATFDSQSASFANLTASFGQSGTEILAAIQGASRGTLSDFAAIKAGNEALLLGVAKTPAEFERFTRAALVLGRTVGLDATESISRFTTALGRESLLRLDDFGNKAAEVNDEVERFAQAEFGKMTSELTKAERSTAFIEAALRVSGANVDKIGDEAGNSVESFQRLEASTENVKTTFGLLLNDLNQASGFTEGLSAVFDGLQKSIQAMRGNLGFGGINEEISATEIKIQQLNNELIKLGADRPTGSIIDFITGRPEKIAEARQQLAALESQLAELNLQRKEEESTLVNSTKAIEENTVAVEQNEDELKALQNAVKQAEQLQLSFARAAEDSARKLGRQQEKLGVKQAKARDKLLIKQQKDLDNFESNRLKSIAEAERDIAKERQGVARNRIKQQQDLQRQLKQNQERFNLDRMQSERRFQLDDKRLRAEGDILALQQLREDHTLQELENKENFDLQKGQSKENTQAQLKEAEEETKQREQELQQRLNDLKLNLENERAQLLQGFDNQFLELEVAQEEQRQALLVSYAEQQEDARINQQRQLEDLGRSLSEEEAITKEGADKIAQEIEKVFGMDGVADQIFSGFRLRTESEFRGLFNNIGNLVSGGTRGGLTTPAQSSRLGGLPSLDDGGVVGGSGPVGSPQVVQAHKGETFIPTHKMSLPAIASQNLNVNMSGGLNLTGAEGASSGTVDAAVQEMVDSLEIAIQRIARRN